ncbi:MAG: hypothetical protein AAFX07_09755 [Pseudomonadota bacterium]
MSLTKFTAVVAAMTMSVSSAMAGAMTPVELEPMKHVEATLVVIGADGQSMSYTPAELEQFATYSLTTTTPWREEPAEFEGVLLSEVLAAHGLDDATSILVTAENDYSTTLQRELLDSVPILVATRVDGRPHSRRARGPIQFVIDRNAFTASELTSESNFVWMAARIEVGE